MYKIFVSERPIILTNRVIKESGFKVFLLKTVNLEEVIRSLQRATYQEVHLYHPDATQLLPIFKKKLGFRVAGGGLVINKNKELLFIERNNKWDLPKGRAEKGEDIKTTSLREVEEETGVEGLSITKFLQKTYHVYKSNGRFKLKITHWYLMTTNYEGKLTPQSEEGITQAVWKTPENAKDSLPNAYSNVALLTHLYLSDF